MDEIAQGTAAAALILQSVILQALVYHGAMTPAEALEVVDKAVRAAALGVKDKSQMEWRTSGGDAWREFEGHL